MLRPSRKMMFAIEAVLDIAYNAADKPVQSTEITRRQGIPRRYLEQVLQQLVRAGILTGVRGPRGGYRLAKERRLLTLGEVVHVIAAEDDSEDLPAGSALGREVVRPVVADLQHAFAARLDAITFADLCGRAVEAGVEREIEDVIDYTI